VQEVLLGSNGMRFHVSQTTRIVAAAVVAGAMGTWFGLRLGGPHHISTRRCGTESHIGRFEAARRLVVAERYWSRVVDREDEGAWVFVVADDMDGQAEVHFVKWSAEAGGSVVSEHREVRLDGLATTKLRLIDMNGDRQPEVIVRVAGGSYSRTVIISFEATKGQEILFDDTEWPPAFRTDFSDLDGDGKCEMIRQIEGSKFALRGDSRKWASVSHCKQAYMIYRLRHGRYGLAKVTCEKPKPSESR